MKILQVTVNDKIAAYNEIDGVIVCGNSDYQIKFTFDEEWAAHPKKTARFEWGGHYHDVEFEGDTCPVPVITNADKCYVGVYVGEEPKDEHVLSSTRATITCQKSVRCGAPTASAGTGENYTNEARGYATEAKAAAKTAEDAAAEVARAGGMKQVATLTVRLTDYEEREYTYEDGMNGLLKFPKIGGYVPDSDRMLLLKNGEYTAASATNTLYSQLIGIFTKRFVVISVNTNGGLYEDTIHIEKAGGTSAWGGNITSPYTVPSNTYSDDVTHIVFAENLYPGNSGEGPFAEYLKLSNALWKAIIDSLNTGFSYQHSVPELKFTAYN